MVLSSDFISLLVPICIRAVPVTLLCKPCFRIGEANDMHYPIFSLNSLQSTQLLPIKYTLCYIGLIIYKYNKLLLSLYK
jgi:hypothetical protein